MKSSFLLSLPVLSVLTFLSIFGALFFGAYTLDFTEVLTGLTMNGDQQTNYLLLNIRLPRILLSALTGAGLAISGAAIQGLFRNPLADQTLIGVTGGAMLFAVLSIVLFGSTLAVLPEFFKQLTLALFAFGGGILTTYGVYFLSKKNGKVYVMTMLLAGIAVSAFSGAITGIFIFLSDDQQLRDITFWSLGSFGGATWLQFLIAAPIVGGSILVLIRYAKALNALLPGEKEAAYLGIEIEKVKSRIIAFTALIVGVCIAFSGIIGFVGLVIPHALRLLYGTDYRYLLRSSALVGALFLVTADTLARTIIAPAELPIGILTAMVGAPFFLWLLLKTQREKLIL
ncbi:MAG: iron complex transport system permease protein [Saprospiraceae bacterium]|jgi:iron complex transport system permease protein